MLSRVPLGPDDFAHRTFNGYKNAQVEKCPKLGLFHVDNTKQ
jgi:hypothetical protein